jgi:hypothetical protein
MALRARAPTEGSRAGLHARLEARRERGGRAADADGEVEDQRRAVAREAGSTINATVTAMST